MILIDFKKSLKKEDNHNLPKIDYKFMNSVVTFNGKYDKPIYRAASYTEYKMYMRVFLNHLKEV